MSRFLLQVALPLFAPFVIYVTWLWYAQKRAERHGNKPPAFTKGAAFTAIVAGGGLAVASLVTLALLGGEAPTDGRYVAPQFRDGVVVGPHYETEPPKDTGSQYRTAE